MDVTVLSLSQDVSFDDGSITNFVQFRLPSGHIIRAVVGDDSAKLLIENLAASKTGAPVRAPEAPRPPPVYQQREEEEDYPTPKTTEDGAAVFGGDFGTGIQEDEPYRDDGFVPPAAQEEQEPLAPAKPRVQTADEQLRAFKQRNKGQPYQKNPLGTQNARTIPKDSQGYPIVNRPGGVDVGEVVGGSGADEDGIGQI